MQHFKPFPVTLTLLSDFHSDGDSDSSDDSLEKPTYHGNRIIPKIRTTFVRDSFKNRHLEAMAEEPEYKM